MSKYPIFIELKNKRVVIVGGGQIAFRKAQALLEAKCRLVVVTKEVCNDLETLCSQSNSELILGSYQADYLDEALLVVAATSHGPLNEQIYQDCQTRQILCNIVDQPDLCDFYVPALVTRGSLQIAVSTQGASPAFASHVRQTLEQLYTEKHSEFLELLRWAREQTLACLTDPTQKKTVSRWLAGDASFEVFVKQGQVAWRTLAEKKITEAKKP
jgi:siroheme synthase-like protein